MRCSLDRHCRTLFDTFLWLYAGRAAPEDLNIANRHLERCVSPLRAVAMGEGDQVATTRSLPPAHHEHSCRVWWLA